MRGQIGVREAAVIALVLAAWLAPRPTRADDTGDARRDEAVAAGDVIGATGWEVAVRTSRGPEGIEVEGRCRVDASRATAWSVLTDYDGIDRFVSSMRESRVTEHGDGYVLVEQVAVGGAFFFSRRLHVTLRVREEPQVGIRFEDVLRRDFGTYRGDWRLEDAGSGLEIVYRVCARPAFAVPDFVVRGAFRRTVRALLTEVANEIDRRSGLATREVRP